MTLRKCSRAARLSRCWPQMIEPGCPWQRMAIQKALYLTSQKQMADDVTEWELRTMKQDHCVWGRILILLLQILIIVSTLSPTLTLPAPLFFPLLVHPIRC